MGEIIIRTLTKEDVIGAAEIKVSGWKTAYNGIVDSSFLDLLNVDSQAANFNNFIDSENFIVAVEDGRVVGFCRFMYDNSFSSDIEYADCELTAIYVRPECKGKGIGTKLFEYVLNKFNNQNKTTMILWCLADNVNSIEFYKHMGGIIQEIRPVEIGDKSYKEVGIVYNVKELCEQKRK